MNDEFRRRPRRRIHDSILVTDVMTNRVIGRIGNLSETGMLLIADTAMIEDALYQFSFQLPDDGTAFDCEFGAHLLWMDSQTAAGVRWAGFRFMGVPEAQATHLRAWLDRQRSAG